MLRLERHPSLRATFNLVPSLVDQIEDAVAGVPDDRSSAARSVAARRPCAAEIRRCRMLPPPHARERWPRLRELVDATASPPWTMRACGARAWFLLAWLDPYLGDPGGRARRSAPRRRHRRLLAARA